MTVCSFLDENRDDPLSNLFDGTIEEFHEAEKYQYGFCEHCNYELDMLIDDSDLWGNTPDKVVHITDWVETYHHDLGGGADYTMNVLCPRCGKRTAFRTGYP